MKFRELIGGIGVIDLSKEITESSKYSLAGVDKALDEASFSSKNLSKLAELYGKILGKKMGGQFVKISEESYNRKMGPGKGIRTMNNGAHGTV